MIEIIFTIFLGIIIIIFFLVTSVNILYIVYNIAFKRKFKFLFFVFPSILLSKISIFGMEILISTF